MFSTTEMYVHILNFWNFQNLSMNIHKWENLKEWGTSLFSRNKIIYVRDSFMSNSDFVLKQERIWFEGVNHYKTTSEWVGQVWSSGFLWTLLNNRFQNVKTYDRVGSDLFPGTLIYIRNLSWVSKRKYSLLVGN